MFGGAYITFIDSDDWVDSDYLEVLYNALIDENADISVSTYKKISYGRQMLVCSFFSERI